MKIVERNSRVGVSIALILLACGTLALSGACSNFNTNGDEIQGSGGKAPATAEYSLSGTVNVGSAAIDLNLWYDFTLLSPDDPLFNFKGGSAQYQDHFSILYPLPVRAGLTVEYTVIVNLDTTITSTPPVSITINGTTTSLSSDNLTISDKKLTVKGTILVSSDTTFVLNINK
jgi:hypothetical protein